MDNVKTITPEAIRAQMVFEDLQTLRLCIHFVANAQDARRYHPAVINGLEAMRSAMEAATLNGKGQHVATMEEDAAQLARFALVTHYYEGQKFYNAAMFEAIENIFK